jgi:hypothetical protein
MVNAQLLAGDLLVQNKRLAEAVHWCGAAQHNATHFHTRGDAVLKLATG